MSSRADLVLPNIAEFNLSRFAGTLTPHGTAEFHQAGRVYGDQCVFWSSADRVLVLPAEVDAQWLADVHEALGDQVPAIITPGGGGAALVSDLLADGAAMAALRGALGEPREVSVLCWAASRELYPMLAAVASWGHTVAAEAPASKQFWTCGYLDSKLSCLDLKSVLPDLRVPRSWTVSSPAELHGAIDYLRAAGNAAVVKSPWGVGGEGIHTVPATEAGLDWLWRSMEKNPFFRSYPMIVQEAVAAVPEIDTPSVDLFIGAGTTTTALTSVTGPDGRQLLTLGRGTGVLPIGLEDEAHATAARIADWAGQLGYRGWLGTDFLAASDGRLYLLELNARRTGGVHAAALLERQPDRDSAVACVADALELPGQAPVSYDSLRELFLAAWDRGERIYPSTVRLLGHRRPRIGLVALGSEVRQARNLLTSFSATLSQRAAARTTTDKSLSR
jgi:hypothetical protein